MCSKVNVANIFHEATDEEIESFLELAGPLKKKECKIIREKETHKVTGFFTYVD